MTIWQASLSLDNSSHMELGSLKKKLNVFRHMWGPGHPECVWPGRGPVAATSVELIC